MCMGGGFKKILPLAALAAAAYFTGGGSLAATGAGAGAAGAGAAGAGAASSVGGSSVLAGLTEGAVSGAGLASSAVPTMTSALTSGSGIGSALTAGLNFAKDNSFWLGQGLNAAGVGANYIGNQQRIADYNKISDNYLAKTNALQNQADAINNASLTGFSLDNQTASADGAYQKRLDASKGAYTSPQTIYMPTADSAPKEVSEANAAKISDILDYGRNNISNSAKLASFGDVNMNNNLGLAESARKIGTLTGFQNGNTNVFNSQANTNMMTPRTADTIGGILQGTGAIANAYASTRPRIKV